jgi:branched-chain amino acid transport system ATP-binding protein
MTIMLRIDGLSAGYSKVPVLRGVSITVEQGETVALIGPNGAGKSTLARSISGFTKVMAGQIQLDGIDITGHHARQRARQGVVQVPEGRRLFPQLSVAENLELAFFTRPQVKPAERRRLMHESMELFPVLVRRAGQPVSTLSGGEQQMVAIVRALLMKPRLLILDEPSIGLAASIREQVFGPLMNSVEQTGCACLLIEQRAHDALGCATRGYVLERGEIVLEGSSQEILEHPVFLDVYVGA